MRTLMRLVVIGAVIVGVVIISKPLWENDIQFIKDWFNKPSEQVVINPPKDVAVNKLMPISVSGPLNVLSKSKLIYWPKDNVTAFWVKTWDDQPLLLFQVGNPGSYLVYLDLPVGDGAGLVLDTNKGPQPIPKPEPGPKPAPKPEPEPKPQPKPEPKPEPGPQPKPEPKPEPQPEKKYKILLIVETGQLPKYPREQQEIVGSLTFREELVKEGHVFLGCFDVDVVKNAKGEFERWWKAAEGKQPPLMLLQHVQGSEIRAFALPKSKQELKDILAWKVAPTWPEEIRQEVQQQIYYQPKAQPYCIGGACYIR